MRRNSLVSIGVYMSAIAVVIGVIVYFAIQDVCPKCHSNGAVARRWSVPRDWQIAHGWRVIRPETVPGASQFWYCSRCGLCWTNTFDASVLCDQGGYPVVPQ